MSLDHRPVCDIKDQHSLKWMVAEAGNLLSSIATNNIVPLLLLQVPDSP